MTMTFRSPDKAFDDAIELGILNLDSNSHRYAGKWMYMGTDKLDGDAFKNIITRDYIYSASEAIAIAKV